MSHTQLPWERVEGNLDLSLTDRSDYSVITCREIRSQDNDTIVLVVTDTGQEDGEEAGKGNYDYILQAVNSHQAMKEALEAISARMRGEYDHPSLVTRGPLHNEIHTMKSQMQEWADQALSLANGKDKEP